MEVQELGQGRASVQDWVGLGEKLVGLKMCRLAKYECDPEEATILKRLSLDLTNRDLGSFKDASCMLRDVTALHPGETRQDWATLRGELAMMAGNILFGVLRGNQLV